MRTTRLAAATLLAGALTLSGGMAAHASDLAPAIAPTRPTVR
ncbi:hypothetical protein [Streptomyces sp. ISL-36]|nr:hypothetical protein [Streptomyces sp. ISL-36]